MDSNADADNVGDYLISSRSLREYEAMFALGETDLRGAVLDCPGGASSFTAEASGRGASVIAVDPVYELPAETLRQLVLEETDRGSAHTAAGIDRYRWDFYGSLREHRDLRRRSALTFAGDFGAHQERYVPASLPALPFDDDRFDLVLSSHFLFTYADRLDLDFHLRALVEMRRVCRREVRVFPLLDQAGRDVEPMTSELRRALRREGIGADTREVPYEFQRGGNRMLALSATTGPQEPAAPAPEDAGE